MYLLLLLLSTSYTKYKISINTKEKQKNRKAKNLTVTTSLYAQMFYTKAPLSERPRDASCLSVALKKAFNSTIRRAQGPLQIYRCVQINSVLCSSSSMLQAVINKDSQMHGGRLYLLFALQQSSVDSYIAIR